jgi:hypothetical protein
VDLVDQRDDERRRVLVEAEVLGELGEQPEPREVGLAEGEPPFALRGLHAFGRDEGAEPRHAQALDPGHHLGLGIEAGRHGTTPLRGS